MISSTNIYNNDIGIIVEPSEMKKSFITFTAYDNRNKYMAHPSIHYLVCSNEIRVAQKEHNWFLSQALLFQCHLKRGKIIKLPTSDNE